MKQYIDKSALVAEIEKRINKELQRCATDTFIGYSQGCVDSMRNVLSFLDTIETKEVDLENSMVCKVDWYDGFLLDYTQEQQDALLEKIGANVGDKVRVILIKE